MKHSHPPTPIDFPASSMFLWVDGFTLSNLTGLLWITWPLPSPLLKKFLASKISLSIVGSKIRRYPFCTNYIWCCAHNHPLEKRKMDWGKFLGFNLDRVTWYRGLYWLAKIDHQAHASSVEPRRMSMLFCMGFGWFPSLNNLTFLCKYGTTKPQRMCWDIWDMLHYLLLCKTQHFS